MAKNRIKELEKQLKELKAVQLPIDPACQAGKIKTAEAELDMLYKIREEQRAGKNIKPMKKPNYFSAFYEGEK